MLNLMLYQIIFLDFFCAESVINVLLLQLITGGIYQIPQGNTVFLYNTTVLMCSSNITHLANRKEQPHS